MTKMNKRVGNRQNLLLLKTNSLIRHLAVRFNTNLPNLYIVTEHPKSGGTWASQMVAEYLNIPFPRNRMPVLGAQLMHCHETNIPNINNLFVIFRDGRDVMISYYYHSFFYNNLYNARHVDRILKNISFTDYDNIRDNLPNFIEFLFNDGYYPKLTWTKFVNSWADSQAPIIKYENLLLDAQKELGDALLKVTGQKVDQARLNQIIDKYSFRSQAKRKSGDESKSSWLRKGIAGDYKNVFSKKSGEVFDHYAGDALIKAGYEIDHSWVNDLD